MRARTIVGHLMSACTAFAALQAFAQTGNNILTGDTRLACEAIMCLATSQRPHECNPAIQRYFGINFKKPGDTVRARIAFLNQCPSGSQTPEMQAFVVAVSMGAGQCDALSINRVNAGYDGTIRDVMPSYCTSYAGNGYTGGSIALPRYVGIPARGGYWVEPSGYEQALAQYNARIRQEDDDRLLKERNREYVPAGGN